MRKTVSACFFVLLLAGCATLGGPEARAPKPEDMTVKVADAVLRDFPEPPAFDWGEGVLMAGMMRACQMTGDDRYLGFVWEWANHWAEQDVDALLREKGYCGHWGSAFPVLLLYEVTGDPKHLALAQKIIDFMENEAERTRDAGLAHFRGAPQLWVDTLYMACPVYSHAARILNRPEYQHEAVSQLLLSADKLQDPTTHLFCHMYDDATGERTHEFWARGNGWVTMSLIETLRQEQPGSQDWHPLLSVLAPQLQAIAGLQDPQTGLWHTVLDAPDTYVETSASAMLLFALAEARRMGAMSAIDDAVLQRAWHGLTTRVDAQGRVTGVSGGTGPTTREGYAAIPTGTETWGTGAFLMAAWAYDQTGLARRWPKVRPVIGISIEQSFDL